MKSIIATLLLCVVLTAQAQMIVKGKVGHARPDAAVLFNVPYENWYYPENNIEIHPDRKGEFEVKLALHQPQVFFVRYGDQNFKLYGEPRKTLRIQIDADEPGGITFGGELATENTFRNRMGLSDYSVSLSGDRGAHPTPGALLKQMLEQQPAALVELKKLEKTSAAFQRITRVDLRYFPISKLWDFFFKYPAGAPKIKREDWVDALVMAYSAQPLSDTEALDSYHYQNVVTYYPRYVMMKEGKGLAEKIFHMPFDTLWAKGERYMEYGLWEQGLTGPALERAKASFIIHGVLQGELGYLNEAYTDFVRAYPASVYRKKVDEVMQPYLAARANENGFEFLTGHGYKDLAGIIAARPGRVLYIDVWGTWCGPCREQFSHVGALKEKFKDQPVDFLYVAVEKPEAPVNVWKETVSFYNLRGTHILAGKDLAASLRDLYKADENGAMVFPSYLLVDKHGKLITAHAHAPSDGEALYKEITTVLNNQ